MPGRSVEVEGIHFWVQLPERCAECRDKIVEPKKAARN